MEKFYVYIKYLNNCAIVCVMKYLNSCMNAANVHTKFLCQYQRVVYFISWTNGIIRELEVLVNGIFEGWSLAVCWVYLNIPSHFWTYETCSNKKTFVFLFQSMAIFNFLFLYFFYFWQNKVNQLIQEQLVINWCDMFLFLLTWDEDKNLSHFYT